MFSLTGLVSLKPFCVDKMPLTNTSLNSCSCAGHMPDSDASEKPEGLRGAEKITPSGTSMSLPAALSLSQTPIGSSRWTPQGMGMGLRKEAQYNPEAAI